MISIIKEEVEEALNILNFIKDDFRTGKDLHTGKPMFSTPAVCSYNYDYGKSFQIALSVLQAYVEGRLVEPMSREEIVSKLMVIDKYIGVSSFPKENYEIIADALSGKISAPREMGEEEIVKILEFFEPIDLSGQKVGMIYRSQYKEVAKALKKGK